MTQYLAKDFIETAEGLLFAVVENGLEQGRVLAFLRYVHQPSGWQKINTKKAHQLLQERYPDYLYYCSLRDTNLHAVELDRITTHHQPRLRLKQLMQQKAVDSVHLNCQQLINYYHQHGVNCNNIGITGSLLIGTQQAQSDIDLVVYHRASFNKIRAITRQLINAGHLQALSNVDWQACYLRRACELSLEDYIWHEQRKFNKALIKGRKFDLSLVPTEIKPSQLYQKQGQFKLTARIIDDSKAFDYPAILVIDHPQIAQLVCYTNTYVGQAINGETVEAAGLLELTAHNQQRLIIGSNREAADAYIKVLDRVGLC